MPVVSVMNYKGGVGKTTIVANLGAELANRGHKVLMIDLDPQASLTFSFITPADWEQDYADSMTIRSWFDSLTEGRSFSLSKLIFSPERVAKTLGGRGCLHLIASHLGLINVDLELATELVAANLPQARRKYLRVHGRLSQGLKDLPSEAYDLVLIDCPPNFNIVTKTAIVASHSVLIPAKPDYLSTLGIDYVYRNLDKFVAEYNEYVEYGTGDAQRKITPEILGVVFTMLQIYNRGPIKVLQNFMTKIEDLGIAPLKNHLRDNKAAFAGAPQTGIPVVLGGGRNDIIEEIRDFVTEFEEKSGLGAKR